jgi:hypothetical protein
MICGSMICVRAAARADVIEVQFASTRESFVKSSGELREIDLVEARLHPRSRRAC